MTMDRDTIEAAVRVVAEYKQKQRATRLPNSASAYDSWLDYTCDQLVAAIRSLSPSHGDGGGWQPIETAPKDGAWLLLRGRNSAGRPMIPVVAAWGAPGAPIGWRDSGTFKNCDSLAAEPGADWHPLPDASPPSPSSQGTETGR